MDKVVDKLWTKLWTSCGQSCKGLIIPVDMRPIYYPQ